MAIVCTDVITMIRILAKLPHYVYELAVGFLLYHGSPTWCSQNMLCLFTLASFRGSSPAFCRILYSMRQYSMRQKAGEEPGNEAMFT